MRLHPLFIVIPHLCELCIDPKDSRNLPRRRSELPKLLRKLLKRQPIEQSKLRRRRRTRGSERRSVQDGRLNGRRKMRRDSARMRSVGSA